MKTLALCLALVVGGCAQYGYVCPPYRHTATLKLNMKRALREAQRGSKIRRVSWDAGGPEADIPYVMQDGEVFYMVRPGKKEMYFPSLADIFSDDWEVLP